MRPYSEERIEQLERQLAEREIETKRLDTDKYWVRGWVWGFIAGLSVMFVILVKIGG